MPKVLYLTLLLLLLFGCSQQDVTVDNRISTQKAMLKALCKEESACFNKIDTLAKSCRQKTYDLKNFDELSDMDQIMTSGEFNVCIIRQMGQGFQNRFDQAIPVTETGVEISRPSTSTNTKGLLVRLMKNGVRFTDKSKQRNTDVPIKDLRDYIQNQKLAKNHSMVLLFVDKDADTGDMVEVMDIFKSTGIEKIHVAGGH